MNNNATMVDQSLVNINEKEGKNLNWFWNAWFYSYGYPDVAITNAEQHDGYISVNLENVGGLPVQFRLTITKELNIYIFASF